MRDPYPYYAWLREHSPVHAEVGSGGRTVWQISRYEDIQPLLSDARLSKEPGRVPGYVPGPAGLNSHVLHADGAEHRKLRGLINSAFTPRRIAGLGDDIRRDAEALLDAVEQHTEIDLIADFAAPLTFRMICRIMGVPGHLSTPAARAVVAATVLLPSAGISSAERQRDERGLAEFLRSLIAHKRVAGAEGEQDLLGALVAACDEAGTMSEEELLSTAYLLLLVGHDTTMNLIGNGMLALLEHPAQKKLLADSPELVSTAVEEFLRYDCPARTSTFRTAAETFELHGHLIRAGDTVCLLLGSAHRDGAAFADPDRLDITRHPNPHLAFGHGPHFCVGAALARLESAIAFPLLLERLGSARLAVPAGELEWKESRVMRGLARLPLVRI
ncbi:hypothetical protein AMK27_36330 [Streptomyces sp. CB02009]|uniref:cytochrome P450 family protein n=1 Tax=Streptomyces sp. CB02009 TaxID=1703938 RepID=UPI00093D8AD4|nr:cytochrome P450 [Streptomyces sp. CB02009]OKJ49528.1 hypothetical protein AMK27_36330 [Streptomyces sp. CB02009]